MPVLLLIVAIFVGIALIAWWFSHAQPSQILGGFRTAMMVLAGIVLAWLLVFRLYFAAALVPLIGFALWRLAPNMLGRMRATAQGRRYGRQSGVRTRWLAMTLDHVTGEADGQVLQGRFAGRRLVDLALTELLALRSEVAGDPQSLALLEAWLDRAHADWRNLQPQAGEGHGRAPMTREQAFAVLGLAPGASADEIKQAHRRLMQKLHPDHGGSDWLAAELNEAKDLLLHGAG